MARHGRALADLSDREMLTMVTAVLGHLLQTLVMSANAHAEATKAGRLVDLSLGDDLRDGVLAARAAHAACEDHLARAIPLRGHGGRDN